MAYDFPASPSNGQTFTPAGGPTFVWNGYAWDRLTPAFTSGTAMLFQQSAAPTGWTKQTTHNDKALRIVSGTVGTGGATAFSTVFSRTTTDAFTLTTNEMPAHAHGVSDPSHAHSVYDPSHTHSVSNSYGPWFQGYYGGGPYDIQGTGVNNAVVTQASADGAYTGIGIYGAGTGIGIANNGSGASHSHGIDTRVLYVDVIIATKD